MHVHVQRRRRSTSLRVFEQNFCHSAPPTVSSSYHPAVPAIQRIPSQSGIAVGAAEACDAAGLLGSISVDRYEILRNVAKYHRTNVISCPWFQVTARMRARRAEESADPLQDDNIELASCGIPAPSLDGFRDTRTVG